MLGILRSMGCLACQATVQFMLGVKAWWGGQPLKDRLSGMLGKHAMVQVVLDLQVWWGALSVLSPVELDL